MEPLGHNSTNMNANLRTIKTKLFGASDEVEHVLLCELKIAFFLLLPESREPFQSMLTECFILKKLNCILHFLQQQ